ncbi:hypothetical protein LTR36_007176 [Oleoguttula mirabilis]|uniref:Uncharacterized protein n=1 Tax=Oleoguttula mirabilis TaxID=1507867 RepID=A0AAV9JAZ9_9PEZI|nr:hypothetical protein LTR36_007176 [Oleoguttula mirabilis]
MAPRALTAQLRPKQGSVASARVKKQPAASRKSRAQDHASRPARGASKPHAKRTTKTPAAPKKKKNKPSNLPSPLLSLPAELRNEIYALALTPAPTSSLDLSKPKLKEPGLLRACKQTRAEAEPIFYTSTAFSGTIRNLDFTIVNHRIRHIHSLGIQTLAPIHLRIVGQYRQRWTLKPLLPFVQVLAATGMQLRAHPGKDMFSRGNVFEHSFEGMEMGAKAFAEGWGGERLEDEFVQWADDREARRQVWCGEGGK